MICPQKILLEREMGWACGTCRRETPTSFSGLKLEGKRALGKCEGRWEGNFKLDLKN